MTNSLVKVHVHNTTGTLTLNRPDKRNAISRELLQQLEQGFRDLHGERKVRAVILTGAAETFCSGLDLSEMQSSLQSSNPFLHWKEETTSYRELLELMLQFPKPIIAALNGPALAAGAGLALACDIVVAAKNASFGFPEPRRGLVSGIAIPLLNFRIGAGRAAPLLLTAEPISATEAHRLGIFHELVDYDKIWARAVEIANQCASSAPEALLLTKRMLNETIGEQLASLFQTGAAVSATSRTTEAAAEGIAAFTQKRPPKWL